MSAPAEDDRDRGWTHVAAAVDAAVRELPHRLMYLDPRLADAVAGSDVTRGGLHLAGNWSAPARAREATSRACAASRLPAALGAAASVVTLRAVSGAVAAGAGPLTVKVEATGAGVYVSIRAGGAEAPAVARQAPSRGGPAAPWGLGVVPGREASGLLGSGMSALFGVAVDAWGSLDDRADTILWFELRTPLPQGP